MGHGCGAYFDTATEIISPVYDESLGRVEDTIFSCDFEPFQRRIDRMQGRVAAEGHHGAPVIESDAFKPRAATVDSLAAVGARQCEQCQPLSHEVFARRVYIERIPQVGVDRHAGVGNQVEGAKLRFDHQREQNRVLLIPETVHREVVIERRELHVIERHLLPAAPCRPPVGHHCGHVVRIFGMAAFVRFALVPDEPPQRVRCERSDHGVVECPDPILGVVPGIGRAYFPVDGLCRLGGHPCLDARGAPVAFDQSDRNAEGAVQPESEVIPDGAEPGGRTHG